MRTSEKTHFYKQRYWFVIALILLIISVLLIRDVQLHFYDRNFLQDQGEKRFLRTDIIPAYRGMITDRNGSPLAISAPVISLWMNPKQLFTARAQWPELARTLELSPAELENKISQNLRKEFVYLKRQISPEMAERAMALDISGLNKIHEYHRYYPAGEVVAHLVGFTNIDDRGQEGLELAHDAILHGVEGHRKVIKNRKGHEVKDLGVVAPAQPGRNIALSIDVRMQYAAYRALQAAIDQHKAKSGSVVAVDVRTGEVLLMVNQPSYNPNNRKALTADALRNRAVTDVLEPGSTMKPFTIMAAFEAGKYKPNTPIDTNPGRMKIGNKWVKDFHNYGLIDVTGILTKSSNVGASVLALSLDSPNQLVDLLHRVGFGKPTDSLFPGERAGALQTRARWAPVEVATLSYGYGFSVTALQLVHAYAALANDGQQMPVTLLKANQLAKASPIFKEQFAHQLVSMMETVLGDEGTAQKARVPGYRVAGKTGTVHNLSGGSYDQNRYTSLFAGVAPASHPQIAMVVIINDPQGEYYGGLVAAPVFSQVMTEILKIRGVAPDQGYILGS